MELTISNSLCRGLRATGIPKAQAHQIQNEFTKWYNSNGPDWVNSRIKDLRQWFESYLAGDVRPPVWFKHDRHGMPLGIWRWVFKLDPAKALGVLSCNTVLYSQELTVAQKEKFLKGVSGGQTRSPQEVEKLLKFLRRLHWKQKDGTSIPMCPVPRSLLPDRMPELVYPSIFDMNGSIPIHDAQSSLRPGNSLGKAANALAESWLSLPQVTYQFLDNGTPALGDLGPYMPWPMSFNEAGLGIIPHTSQFVGRVSVLQQPELKARVVGNPNRVMQVTLDPLKKLYMSLVKRSAVDVTFRQEEGVSWVQEKLKEGITLSGSDLSSASDLLDVDLSLDMLNAYFGFDRIPGYTDYETYYRKVCKSQWWCPDLKDEAHPNGQPISWKSGSVLGTGPSFGVLTLTNGLAARIAYFQLSMDSVIHYPVSDAYRVLGDDIIMRAELQPYYNRVITVLGGEINFTKTLTSNKVAEFAGRVITPERVFLKRIKYSEPSDDSFMSYMAQLGDQAKYFLQPKQRTVYEFFRYVPGIIIDGPWSQDSFGEPLADRYHWYLSEVQPRLSREEPDRPSEAYEMTLLRARLDAEQLGLNIVSSFDGKHRFHYEGPSGGAADVASYLVPAYDAEGYLPSQTPTTFRTGGDPRRPGGQSLVDALNKHLDGSIRSYEDWKRDQCETSLLSQAVEPTERKTPPRHLRR
uniref:RNA-directed RNA polymerase n=1 Tax=Jeanralphio narna-like virus TaxID=2716644 RepID=A0A6G7PSA2_9VIRU|nr:RNA-dependent RNA polymerase [Jeanralphio narna-like virus]